MRRSLVLGGLLTLLASCGTPGAAYVKADRETFNSVGQDYKRYVLQDGALTTDQRDRRLLAVELWGKRLAEAESNR